jgi:hypothetical protein
MGEVVEGRDIDILDLKDGKVLDMLLVLDFG